MLSMFKPNAGKKLRNQYSAKLEQAMHAQRKGDIESYSELTPSRVTASRLAINAIVTQFTHRFTRWQTIAILNSRTRFYAV